MKLIIGHKNCTDQNCPRMYQYYSKIERDLKLAIKEERHQVGSLLKPLVYDFFIDHGKKWDDMVGTSPITLNLKLLIPQEQGLVLAISMISPVLYRTRG